MPMKLKITSILIAALLLICGSSAADAAVYTVEEPANGDTIYIAGDPDMYPIEYYDAKSKEYKGILPELYKRISGESGIDFSYISAGEVNEQYRLAKNNQVELVSAHAKGNVDNLTKEIHIITYSKGNKEIELCIGFTSVAPPDLIRTVTAELDSISSEELLRLTVEALVYDSPEKFPYWLIIIIAVLAIICLLFVVNYIIRRKKEKKERENRLTDSLTGIGNSLYFEKWYNSFISPASHELYYIAYIGIDIHRILQYAETSLSQELQVFAASEITASAGETDFCARVSEGHFALAFAVPSREQADEFIRHLLSRLDQFNHENVIRYHIRFQAGVFHLDAPNIPCEKALFNARYGFVHALETGEPYVFADSKLLRREEYVQGLKKKLRDAVDKKEFRLYVQYIFDGKGEMVCGAEALSRWDSPEQGLIGPSDYIYMLEDSEMIDELDYYILGECCHTLSEWKRSPKKNLWLSCNMTRITLSEDSFAQKFRDIIEKYDFDTDKLVIEITEDAIAESKKQIIDNIAFCKRMGCRIALDDFGSGYSSVMDMNDYPIDILKIDRKLITKTNTEKGKQLLRGIVKLAHYTGIMALCEGVETKDEIAAVADAHCDYIQGYLLSRANPVNERSADRNITFL